MSPQMLTRGKLFYVHRYSDNKYYGRKEQLEHQFAEAESVLECLKAWQECDEKDLKDIDIASVCTLVTKELSHGLGKVKTVINWPPVELFEDDELKEDEPEEEEPFEWPNPSKPVRCPFCFSVPSPEMVGFWGGWACGEEPPYWQQLRMFVFWRDMFRCRICHKRFMPRKLVAHHIVPKEQGGEDSSDNLVTLCYKCHEDDKPIYSYDSCDEDQENLGQYIGEQPPWVYPQGKKLEESEEEVAIPQTIKDVIGVPSIVRRGKGRPAKDIDDKYLKELRYNEGLSYRQIARKLKNENDYEISRTAIHDHLVKSKHHHIPESAICEYVGCRKEYKPWLENQRYCSPECNARANQRGMPKKKDKKPARRSRKPRK